MRPLYPQGRLESRAGLVPRVLKALRVPMVHLVSKEIRVPRVSRELPVNHRQLSALLVCLVQLETRATRVLKGLLVLKVLVVLRASMAVLVLMALLGQSEPKENKAPLVALA